MAWRAGRRSARTAASLPRTLEMPTGQSGPPACQGWGQPVGSARLGPPRSCPGLFYCPRGSSEGQVGTGTHRAPEQHWPEERYLQPGA